MILIALGANLPSSVGKPAETLRAALEALGTHGVDVRAVSKFYATPAWPNPKDPPFVNAVAHVETTLSPTALLAALHDVETVFGRRRSERNAPRTLDLDLLDYEGRIEPGPPELPHPRMAERGFVLIPLGNIAPEWRHPVTGRSVQSLIAALSQEQRKARELRC
jgi:2-amino-4-hydroxy-6-hydroxymethyldihydropteridine diphosphokinase